MKPVRQSETITKKSQSNLAFAFITLSPARREAMITFYAFCRLMDDIADEPDLELTEKRRQLQFWKQGILHGFSNPDELQNELTQIIQTYQIPKQHLIELIEGMEQDLHTLRYNTFQDLQRYCYLVASAVGLASIRIFGCQHADSEKYALNLGYALQLTNILRDVGDDAEKGRIYLPLDELKQFGVTEEQLFRGEVTDNFRAFMQFQYERATAFYRIAEQHITSQDRRALIAARMMADVYQQVLNKVQRHQFAVFHQRIKLSKAQKILTLLKHWIGSRF